MNYVRQFCYEAETTNTTGKNRHSSFELGSTLPFGIETPPGKAYPGETSVAKGPVEAVGEWKEILHFVQDDNWG